MSEVAVELEAVAPNLGWTIPLALDGLIVVGSAVLWSESMEDRWHLFPLITVVAAAILSVTANIAHAGTDSLLGQALAGVPPVALILAVELAAWQIRRSIRRSNQQQQRTAEAPVAAAAAPAPVAAVSRSLGARSGARRRTARSPRAARAEPPPSSRTASCGSGSWSWSRTSRPARRRRRSPAR